MQPNPMEWFKHIFHQLTDVETLVRLGGLTAMTIIVFAETGLFFGFFLPGDSLLVTAGVFAGTGQLNLLHLILLLVPAAILGDTVGYWFGRKTGPALFKRPKSLLFNPDHLRRAHDFYEKHGGKTIVIARFMPIIRTFAPIVAGMGHFLRLFALWAARESNV
jgi:membrane-associated protein